MTRDVALSLVALLELVPFPDRFVVRQGTQINSELTHKIGARDLVDVFAGDGQRRRRAVSGHVQEPHKLLVELGIQALFDRVALPGVVDASQFEGAPRVRGASFRQEVLVSDRQALCANQGNA